MSWRTDRASSRLLVAAHGLAALRVQQAGDELGLATCLTEGEPEALVLRARALGCHALHPGEASSEHLLALAGACRRDGLRLIAPGQAMLEAMADRIAMRRVMREAGLPLAPEGGKGHRVRVPVLADGQGRVVHLAVRHSPSAGLAMAPVPWLTPEQRCYLGQLAVQGVASLGPVGLVVASFRVAGNCIGFEAISPGLAGDEALDEVLIGIDPVVEQLRIAAGDPLRLRQTRLDARGHALLWQLSLDSAVYFGGGPGLRLDRTIEGGEARLIAWGRRPEVAWRRGRRALVELLGEAPAKARLP
ncbi:hypothetical protein [Halomonas rhizosphaerae]|uniref:Biotin carboxylation domain-containing protein n=1 Tax=Halomonas rhizosphaerae TaxID=3043296 RepID=A0ABT6V333_9GAMM|nr:hypothetical protein [Halomonas rhizosphaerae]MDI5892626.1 hypothetical protein [Halomonas rhizosphaerae]